MSEEQLGTNAKSFRDHICAGLQAGGLDLDDYPMSIVTDKKEVGLLMAQVPLSEMCEEHTLESSEADRLLRGSELNGLWRKMRPFCPLMSSSPPACAR
jgi:hypothetical protein